VGHFISLQERDSDRRQIRYLPRARQSAEGKEMTSWRRRSELGPAIFVFAMMFAMAVVMIGGIVFGLFH
jgi:hypothetical protein